MWTAFCPVTRSFEPGLGRINVFAACNVSELFSLSVVAVFQVLHVYIKYN